MMTQVNIFGILGGFVTIISIIAFGDMIHTDREAEAIEKRQQKSVLQMQQQVLQAFESHRLLTLQLTIESRLRTLELEMRMLKDKIHLLEKNQGVKPRDKADELWYLNQEVTVLGADIDEAKRELAVLKGATGP